MGVLAQQRGDASTAVEHLRRAVDDAPDPSSRADAMFRLGEALLAGGSYAEAETVFQRFLQTFATHPRRAEAGARGAVAICRQDRYEEALPLLSAVEGEVASSPALARLVAYERAWCLARLGRRAESIRAYRAVLALGRRQGEPHPHAMLDLAGLQMEDSDWNAAAALLKELCDSLDTRSDAGETGGAPSELKEQAIYRLGVCAYRLNDFAQAAELLGRFLREFGSSAMVPWASIPAASHTSSAWCGTTRRTRRAKPPCCGWAIRSPCSSVGRPASRPSRRTWSASASAHTRMKRSSVWVGRGRTRVATRRRSAPTAS
jgi:tetratricopeptide (TPR) repeat protein